MGKKHTQEYVEEYIASFGYTLLSNYKNGREHLEIRCPQEHSYKVSFENFKHNGSRCPICSKERLKAKNYSTLRVCDNCGKEYVRKTKKRDSSRNCCTLNCAGELHLKDMIIQRKQRETETTICQCGCGEEMLKYRFYKSKDGSGKVYQPKCKKGHYMPVESNSGQFQKGQTAINKGKTYEEMYGKEKAEELKEVNRQAHIGNTSYWKGKKMPREMVEKSKATRMANGGYARTEEQNQKLSAYLQGILYEDWEGYVTSVNSRDRHTAKYKAWRKSVFERDNYTCQDCGARNYKGLGFFVALVAHHVKEWINYPELRFTVSNGKTLCEKCHRKYSKGAYTNNVIERGVQCPVAV